jgi:type III restriction enzyme
MKFHFKVQQYQSDAVEAVCRVFRGGGHYGHTGYIRDVGKVERDKNGQLLMGIDVQNDSIYDTNDNTGYKNALIDLSDDELLKNIRELQTQNNIKLSPSLVKDLGRVGLDIEMETGTGKTYVYIKTMFELYKRYKWSKFIVVVPSVAIREGVKKSFEITQEHFMEHYSKKARFFIYNSANLHQLDEFSSGSGINVMIINTQAFAASLKEDGKSKDARIIYSKRDEFGSRRPIDVIAANNPIIIRDEPQKMGGEVTNKALQNFKPLFTLNYSATHAKEHNLIYALDALDAFNKRLVKQIEVKGFEIKNFRGTDKYLYLESIVLSSKKPPMARLEFEIAHQKSINRETHILKTGDNLYFLSNKMEQYKEGYSISEIDPVRGTVTFANGEVLQKGDIVGDISEKDMRRIQIRETIISHFEKEEKLFDMGIKTLSLFFIDEVAKYRQYDAEGNETLVEYGQMFEQEYLSVLNNYTTVFDTPYQKYLKGIKVAATHRGYFSIDKKTGRPINSELKRGSEFSDDISAYDLILKNKERLLSFDEPTRFIFSHSALREGWDNPNVFQICTLKHSDSTTMKRQEVGRGLRLCVNQDGNRMDTEALGSTVHTVNMLTVIASESYKNFVGDLQKQIKEVLYERPSKASIQYFEGKSVMVGEQKTVVIDAKQAKDIYRYLIKNDYIDNDDNVTDTYRADMANGSFAPLAKELEELGAGIHTLIQSVFDESVLADMISDGNQTKIKENALNDNFYKKEFQTLWNYINHKYAYTVDFDSKELIAKSIKAITDELYVSELQYTVSKGAQRVNMNEYELERGDAFDAAKTKTSTLKYAETSGIKYDLIGKIAEGTTLTRKSVGTILSSLDPKRLAMFKNNPEEFISKVIKLIKEQKATMIVEHISYDQIEGEYDSTIFTAEKNSQSFEKAFYAKKHVQDYVFTDGSAQQSVERRFAQDLEAAGEVCVYAKLPRGFSIPTPVGNYSPDWAIAFNEGEVKHIYFIAETKGTMESLNLRPIEKAKISCAKKLFNELSSSKVKYHDIDNYQSLLNIMDTL